MRIREWTIAEGWAGPALKIALIADIHAVHPHVPLRRIAKIVAQTNALRPDLILLPGDFLASQKLHGTPVPAPQIADALSDLTAPLGVFAVLGNHDWWDCPDVIAGKLTIPSIVSALEEVGIPVMQNTSQPLQKDGVAFRLAGMDSQYAPRRDHKRGYHDPEKTFADVPAGMPCILMAHEPDYFAQGDPRAQIQVSGHTHGGQLNLFGWRPLTPSAYGGRYAYGHMREGGRHLIVSAGIGYSGIPMRFLQPPEITMVHVEGRAV